ncbi:MAG: hypothetical protein HQM10_18945 [Candidatus Riflebacteria bacterium]|nr:hypothetical protein [Candidatus Riflebacteria bacterium]
MNFKNTVVLQLIIVSVLLLFPDNVLFADNDKDSFYFFLTEFKKKQPSDLTEEQRMSKKNYLLSTANNFINGDRERLEDFLHAICSDTEFYNYNSDGNKYGDILVAETLEEYSSDGGNLDFPSTNNTLLNYISVNGNITHYARGKLLLNHVLYQKNSNPNKKIEFNTQKLNYLISYYCHPSYQPAESEEIGLIYKQPPYDDFILSAYDLLEELGNIKNYDDFRLIALNRNVSESVRKKLLLRGVKYVKTTDQLKEMLNACGDPDVNDRYTFRDKIIYEVLRVDNERPTPIIKTIEEAQDIVKMHGVADSVKKNVIEFAAKYKCKDVKELREKLLHPESGTFSFIFGEDESLRLSTATRDHGIITFLDESGQHMTFYEIKKLLSNDATKQDVIDRLVLRAIDECTDLNSAIRPELFTAPDLRKTITDLGSRIGYALTGDKALNEYASSKIKDALFKKLIQNVNNVDDSLNLINACTNPTLKKEIALAAVDKCKNIDELIKLATGERDLFFGLASDMADVDEDTMDKVLERGIDLCSKGDKTRENFLKLWNMATPEGKAKLTKLAAEKGKLFQDDVAIILKKNGINEEEIWKTTLENTENQPSSMRIDPFFNKTNMTGAAIGAAAASVLSGVMVVAGAPLFVPILAVAAGAVAGAFIADYFFNNQKIDASLLAANAELQSRYKIFLNPSDSVATTSISAPVQVNSSGTNPFSE